MDPHGSLHQAVVLSNRTHASSGAKRPSTMRIATLVCSPVTTSYRGYLPEHGCVFDRQPLSPSSQLLSGALEPMDDEEALRMAEELANNVEEPLNNVALNIYEQEPEGQEPLPTLNALNSTRSTAEEFTGDFVSPQCESGHISHPNLNQYAGLSLVSQCETPSAADLERNVSPFAVEMSPKTYQEAVKDIYLPLQGHVPVFLPMDGTLSFNEYPSYESLPVTTPNQSCYVSSEFMQCEQLQLTTSFANPLPSPMIPLTPGIQKFSTPSALLHENQHNATSYFNTSGQQDQQPEMTTSAFITNSAQASHTSGVQNSTSNICDSSACVRDKTPCAKGNGLSVQGIQHKTHPRNNENKKEKGEHSQNSTREVDDLTMEVLGDRNDADEQLPTPLQRPSSPPSSNSSCEGASSHQQSEHQLTHHEPASCHGWCQYKIKLLEKQVKNLEQEMCLLKEQVMKLEGRFATPDENDVNINWFTTKQNTEVSMILNNPSTNWQKALRKILVIAFGKDVLAKSCSVGRKHATCERLDATKLDDVKGLIYNKYGPNPEITNEAINKVVNNCCSTARRSLKPAPD